MTRQSSSGSCGYCQGSYAKSAMARHLKACKARQEDNESDISNSAKGSAKRTILHLQVVGRDRPMYWMHIEIPASATLTDLDDFLRLTWLECCGHLSCFEIAGETFDCESAEMGNKSMNISLGKVIGPKMVFEHTYDFGTSTELSLKVISARQGLAQGKAVRIMARNDPPDIRCDVCGKPAVAVCCQCIDEGTGFVCEDCAEKHECGEDMLLPVVNSPRMGMCGYTGDAY